MKIFTYSVVFLLSIYSLIFADQIYYKNSKIIQCKIIQITDKTIEYSEEGGRPFMVEQKDLVSKVVYDDGSVVQMDKNNNPDKILLKNGDIIEGKIVEVTQDVIIYNPQVSEKKEAIVRENAIKIIYSNGEEVLISSSDEKNPEETFNKPEESQVLIEEPIIHNGGFIDSIFRISLIGGIGSVWGDIDHKEDQAFNKYLDQVTVYSVYPSDNDTSIEHDRFYGGFEIGLMLPALKFQQYSRFTLSGIKFGFLANYIFSEVDQSLTDRRLEDTDYYDTLLKYRTVNAGPEMNLVFSPRSNKVNFVVRGYLLGGYIHNGELTALPGLREADLSIAKSDYSTGFSGYSVTAGMGLRFVSNLAFPVITGIDLQYTYSKINFDHSLEAYDGADNASFNEIGLLMSVGIHI